MTDINALIAKHVMGWEKHLIRAKALIGWNAMLSFNPEHSIPDAFEALEHWRGQEAVRWYEIGSPYEALDSTFVIGIHAGPTVLCIFGDESLPRAICLALLAAKGVEVPK